MRNSPPIAENRCRLCLCTEGNIKIFGSSQLNIKLMKCFRIKVEVNDGLPKSICNECSNNLKSIWKFKELCENSDFILRNTLHKQYPLDITFPLYDLTSTINKSPDIEKDENYKHEIDHNDEYEKSIMNDKFVMPIPKKKVKIRNDKNMKAIATKFHQCDTCGKHFTRSSHLVIHIRTHTGEKPFKCSKCEKSFSLRHVQQSHERTHTKVKPYHCSSCSRCFTDSSSLSRHSKIHSDQKEHLCRFCPKRFITAYDLRRHQASHTGERMYICQHCNKTFIYGSHLSKHKRTHIKTTQND